jgi:hypothetical protein
MWGQAWRVPCNEALAGEDLAAGVGQGAAKAPRRSAGAAAARTLRLRAV